MLKATVNAVSTEMWQVAVGEPLLLQLPVVPVLLIEKLSEASGVGVPVAVGVGVFVGVRVAVGVFVGVLVGGASQIIVSASLEASLWSRKLLSTVSVSVSPATSVIVSVDCVPPQVKSRWNSAPV